MDIEITKLYKGFADLRDYNIKDAIKKGVNIVIIYNGERMTLTPEQLKSQQIIINSKPIASKIYPDQKYYLISYKWKPDETGKKDN